MRDFDLPGDEPDEQDYAAQAAEREKRIAALERERDQLKAQLGTAAQRSPSATPAGPSAPAYGVVPGGPDPALLAKLSDRSISWPDLQKELAAQGFRDGGY